MGIMAEWKQQDAMTVNVDGEQAGEDPHTHINSPWGEMLTFLCLVGNPRDWDWRGDGNEELDTEVSTSIAVLRRDQTMAESENTP